MSAQALKQDTYLAAGALSQAMADLHHARNLLHDASGVKWAGMSAHLYRQRLAQLGVRIETAIARLEEPERLARKASVQVP